ncbi:hypothetical protein, conserved [Eimeria tenella]|uniref:Uncharacterized protein n=1 Tax=Eimeria tenella TaxID=5802 RepID=U6KUK0_EIMTE|nr:hypothetical protein, conserved [Eimeria tenella]CDJ39180.1 hypothetical protein, conserved [Eimeria tenella]|eukprot:XP_013229935.1 hypothetical protein, conserved [Eimeria tenella]
MSLLALHKERRKFLEEKALSADVKIELQLPKHKEEAPGGFNPLLALANIFQRLADEKKAEALAAAANAAANAAADEPCEPAEEPAEVHE